jgi:hypothetical protein
MDYLLKKAIGNEWSQPKGEAKWAVAHTTVSFTTQTWVYRVQCLPCWVLIFHWSDPSFYDPYSSLLLWECLLICWKYVISFWFYRDSQLGACLEFLELNNIGTDKIMGTLGDRLSAF